MANLSDFLNHSVMNPYTSSGSVAAKDFEWFETPIETAQRQEAAARTWEQLMTRDQPATKPKQSKLLLLCN